MSLSNVLNNSFDRLSLAEHNSISTDFSTNVDMYSFLLFIPFVAFYCFYLASGKIKTTASTRITCYLQQHRLTSRALGYTLLVLSWFIFANLQGLGSGSFLTIVYFMACGSMIVLLKPYAYLKLWHLLALAAIFAGLEIYFF